MPLGGCSGLSGRHFNRGVKIDLPRLPTRCDRAVAGAWNGQSILPKPTYVEFDRPFDPAQCAVDGLARRNAARKIRNRRTPIAVWITVDTHKVLDRSHDFGTFNPACRFTDANVPFGMSSPRPPLTVIRPGLVGCLY